MARVPDILVVLVLAAKLAGCAGGDGRPPAVLLAEARRKLGPLPTAEVCRTLRKVMFASHELFWSAARGYARCLARRGMLAAGRRDRALVLRRLGRGRAAYFEAFLAIASGPDGFEAGRRALVRAHALLSKEWEPAYRLGLLASSQEELEEADRWLRAARKRGGGALVLVALAGLRVRQGRFDEACRLLRAASGQAFSLRTGQRALALSGFMARLGALSAPRALARLRKAEERLGRDLPGLVVEDLGAVEELEDPNLLVALGRAHLRLGNDARAAAAFQRALEGNPHSFVAALFLGRLKLDAGRVSEAVALFQQAVSVAPFSPEARRALAEAWAKSGHWGRAAQAYRVAFLMEPDRPVLLGWVKALRRAGRGREAARVVVKWLEQHAGDADAWVLLGDTYASLYRNSRGEEAERNYERAVSAYRRALDARRGDLVAMARLRALGASVEPQE